MGTYRSQDGHVNIAGAMSLDAFLEVLGCEDLLGDERFATAESRRANRQEFNGACERRLSTAPTAYWVERFNAAGIPSGPVYALDEVFADPQVRHLRLAEPVTDRAGETAQVLRFPVTLTATPASVRCGPPREGAHTREVMLELGYEDRAIDAMVDEGTVATSIDGAGVLP
jgi:crotonobetainyl-CoA:carnitine CoA-transferase CaiB-like acyl-CoA transferase